MLTNSNLQLFEGNKTIILIILQLLFLQVGLSCPYGPEGFKSNKKSSKSPFQYGTGHTPPWITTSPAFGPPLQSQPQWPVTQPPLPYPGPLPQPYPGPLPQPYPGPPYPPTQVRPIFTQGSPRTSPPKTTTPKPLRYVGISYHPEPHYTLKSGAIKICNFKDEVLCCHSSNFTKTEIGDCIDYHIPYPKVPYSILIVLDFKEYPVVDKWKLDTFSLMTNDQMDGVKLICPKLVLLRGKMNNITKHCSWQ